MAWPIDFPHLQSSHHLVTSPENQFYNCIAWAAGDSKRFWWPGVFGYWPPGIPRAETLPAFMEAFGTLGYQICVDDSLEVGWQKVAIYGIVGSPKHAALQLPTGYWTSKLGKSNDIEHTLEGLVGPTYGTVMAVLRRPR